MRAEEVVLTFEDVLSLIQEAISLVLSLLSNLHGFELYEVVFAQVKELLLQRLAGKVIVYQDGGVELVFHSLEEFVLFLQSLFSLRQILRMAGKSKQGLKAFSG